MSIRYPSPRVRGPHAALALAIAACALCGALLSPFAAHARTSQAEPEQTLLSPSSDGPVASPPVKPRAWTPPVLQTVGPAGQTGTLALPNIQSETTVAASGLLVVAGYNDFRGSSSFSGVLYSTDGGQTFADGGQLPTLGAGDFVEGDPCLAVYNPSSGSPIFYYSSIYIASDGVQGMCVHRSTDGGATWAGPFDVPPAHLPSRAADKEWITVDPETGRLFLSWSDFSGPTIRVTRSDDAATASPPTWAASLALGTSGQGSCVAADPNGPNMYVVWRRSTSLAVSRSTDNGVTFATNLAAVPSFSSALCPWGFDRFNSFPSITVNPADHALEMVAISSTNGTPANDFGDVRYYRSTNGGVTFSPSVFLNAFPGTDRPQTCPTVTCASNGRIDVFWYDQSAGSSTSDYTDLFYTYSTNFGASWSSPVPVTPSPFHCEAGNNFSAPHQGDYVDAGSDALTSYSCFAWMLDPHPLGSSPDALVAAEGQGVATAALRVRPGSITIVDAGCGQDDGFLVAGEIGDLAIPLENFGRVNLTGISAVLSALTPNVTMLVANGSYPDLAPGASAATTTGPFRILLDPIYPCGQDARFRLTISANGTTGTFVEFSLRTGVAQSTSTVLTENFDGVVAPTLPAGWTLNNGCPSCALNNWVTTVVNPASPPNAAFAADAGVTTFGRLFGPQLTIPANATYVDVEFDILHDLEQNDARFAFDGASFEYQLDAVGGSHFASADAIDFDYRYTHYVTRSSGGSSGDRSGWSGNSTTYKHVRLRIPGLAGHQFQPRFSLTTDSSVGNTGLWIDNVLVRAIQMGCGPCAPTSAEIARLAVQSTGAGVDLTWESRATDVTGWIVSRASSLEGPWQVLTPTALPMGAGGSFAYRDSPDVVSGAVYYRLTAVLTTGGERVMDTIRADLTGVPATFAASVAGANPFRGRTMIAYALPARAPVHVDVYTAGGRQVRRLVDAVQEAGRYTAAFDLSGAGGRTLPAGVYVIRVNAGSDTRVLRVVAF